MVFGGVWRTSGHSVRACVQAMAVRAMVTGAGVITQLVPVPRPARAELEPADREAAAAFEVLSGSVSRSRWWALWDQAVEMVRGVGLGVPPVIGEDGRPVLLADRSYGWQAAAVVAYHLHTHPGDIEGARAIAGRLAIGHRPEGGLAAGAPKKQVAWTAPPPPTRIDDNALGQAARAALDAGVSSAAVFVAGLRAAGWQIGDRRALLVWTRVRGARQQADARAQERVPAWAPAPPTPRKRPSEEVLAQAAHAALAAGVPSTTAFADGLRAAGWQTDQGQVQLVWGRVKGERRQAAARA